jgi:hypothetical protein
MNIRLFAVFVAQVSNLLYRRLPVGKPLLLAALLALANGCDDSGLHTHETDEAKHAPKVCGYKEGHGVFVGEETQKAIRLQVAEVVMKAGSAGATVPESSLLSTAMGDFVFTVNGDHFQRTAVKTAGLANGWIAVADGLLEGDQVVTNGVRELWRIELQATKAGAACAH